MDKNSPSSDSSTETDLISTIETNEFETTDGLEPLSMSLVGRLFGVPMLIIGSIVGGSIVIVLLFGGTSANPQRSIDELLQVLEANSGEKSLGVLLPQEKQLWQTALELSKRLEKKELELTATEIEDAADRLTAMVRSDLAHFDQIPSFGDARIQQEAVRSRRLEFVIHALGRTESTSAIDPLIEIIQSGIEPYVRVAMQELGNLHTRHSVDQAIEPIIALLFESKLPETKLTACTVLSVLAKKGDSEVIDVLSRVMYANEGEISWSAALSLARLGSAKGKSTLADLLDRNFWESRDRYQITDSSGRVQPFAMPPQRIDDWLIATIDAVSHLEVPLLWELIDRLKLDSSLAVRGQASRVWDEHIKNTASSMDLEG